MKERPILFSAPMVQAILDGRKTQTRRVIKPIGNDDSFVLLETRDGDWWPYRSEDGGSPGHNGESLEIPYSCPYGVPGDQLWVRETWQQPTDQPLIVYRADYAHCVPLGVENVPKASELKWRPSIFMPRHASRITLRVTDTRVEKLKSISEADAKAEGVSEFEKAIAPDLGPHRASFNVLWDSINYKRGLGMATNPWVWVVSFERVPSNGG